MRRNGKLDPRDFNVHQGDADINVVPDAMFSEDKDAQDFELGQNPGIDVWQKYVVFDILYLGGPDAKKVMDKAFGFMKEDARPKMTGSILNLDLMKRKRILHTLIQPQENAIEPVEGLVVRSNGLSMDSREYFTSPEALEHGQSPLILDSINFTLDGIVPNIADVDTKRREGKTDKAIDQQRANALDKFYADVVTKRSLEGLIFKDLASPYCFGSKCRKLGYWYKLKDDYSKKGHASDIDVVVIGGSFANSGGRNKGMLNSLLVACLDDEETPHGTKFMTMGQLSGNSVSDDILVKLLGTTGFTYDRGELSYGSWFKSDIVPDFVSRRTFQSSSNPSFTGWKPEKKDRPDLWIAPEDSFVVTLNSGEIVGSKNFSAGALFQSILIF